MKIITMQKQYALMQKIDYDIIGAGTEFCIILPVWCKHDKHPLNFYHPFLMDTLFERDIATR